MNNPIYKPKGKAGEYGDYAINIYDSCNHGCSYCYARPMAARFGKPWGDTPKPREGIVEATQRQLASGGIKNKLIHLCFTCDPYPADVDTSVTREIIRAIKDSGNHVQILTKGGKRAERDFDLLDENDWFGVTLTAYGEGNIVYEPYAAPYLDRVQSLFDAHNRGIKTWVSYPWPLPPVSVQIRQILKALWFLAKEPFLKWQYKRWTKKAFNAALVLEFSDNSTLRIDARKDIERCQRYAEKRCKVD